MGSKIKKRLLIIYAIFVAILFVAIITLQVLGSKERIGYLEIDASKEKIIEDILDDANTSFEDDIEVSDNNLVLESKILKYGYNTVIRYYVKVFGNSDIFEVYPNINNLPEYIIDIKFQGKSKGSPFGVLTSSIKLEHKQKIDNVGYTLKVKPAIWMYFVILALPLLLLLLLLSLIPHARLKIQNINIKWKILEKFESKLMEKKIFIIVSLFILCLSISLRIYYSSQRYTFHADEFASIYYSNAKSYWSNKDKNIIELNEYFKYNESYSGKEIKSVLYYDDSSIKDALDDIVEMYKYTNDSQISNLYYTFLRLAFIGREVYDINNIFLTGTILNTIFYIISFLFLIRLLRLLFYDDNLTILFSLLCISFMSSSLSFSIFLRPYQMQECFFIIFTYLVLNILLSKKYTKKNFIILTIITGLGYLILTSSIIFVLCFSLTIFIYYLYAKFTYKNILEDKSLIYFALSFVLAFLVSFIFYNGFFKMLGNNFNRADNIVRILNINTLVSFFERYMFNGHSFIFWVPFVLLVYIGLNYFKHKPEINYKKYMPILLLTFTSIFYYITSNIVSPFIRPRYSIGVYSILFILISTILLIIKNNNRLAYFCLILIISIAYIQGSLNTSNILYLYGKPSNDIYIYNKEPQLDVYAVDKLLLITDIDKLNDNQKYTIVEDYENLKNVIKNNNVTNFYLIINNDSKEYDIVKNELSDFAILENIIYKNIGNTTFMITELQKK